MMANLPQDLLVSIAQRVVSFEDFIHFGAVCKSWSSAAIKDNFSGTQQVPWLMMANLPQDLLVSIAQRVVSFEDFIHFGAVCKSWSSAAIKDNFSGTQQVPWLMMANLPQDLLVSIAQRVVSFEDFIHFGAVCKSWSSAAIKDNFSRTQQVPWLMIPDNEDTTIREFYDLKKDKIYKLDFPEIRGSMCYSSLGWLMTQSFGNLKVSLRHPLKHQRTIQLPNLTTFNDHHSDPELLKLLTGGNSLIQKFVLSSSPSFTSDYIVLIHSWERLAFWRPGDQDWTILDAQERRDSCWSYSDITYYKRQFYVVADDGTVSVCEFGHANKKANTRVVVPKMPSEVLGGSCLDYRLYLVEAAGALLLILRRDYRSKFRIMFRVFEVPLSDGRWSSDLEVENLGNITLFLGYNSSFSVNALQHPGCKPNCIYFTNQPLAYITPGDYTGIFHMEDGKIESVTNKLPEFRAPFLWIEPSF